MLFTDTTTVEKPVMVVGDLMLDWLVETSSPQMSEEAPVMKVAQSEPEELFAGGAANVVNNLNSLGAHTLLAGSVGNCEHGTELQRLLPRKRAHNFLFINPTGEFPFGTTIKTRIFVDGRQQMRIDMDAILQGLPSNYRLQLMEKVKGCSALVIADYGKGFLGDQDFREELLNRAKMSEVPIFVDAKRSLYEYRGVQLMKPNEKAFREFLQSSHGQTLVGSQLYKATDNSLAALMKAVGSVLCGLLGWEELVVTAGSGGIHVATADSVQHCPAFPVEAADVTGAGDSVMATLVMSALAGKTISQSLTYANAAGAVAAERIGTVAVQEFDVWRKCASRRSLDKVLYADTCLDLLTQVRDRFEKQKIAFTNGCFDMLHPGHLFSLKESKSRGDFLVVGVNSDSSVEELKRRVPVVRQHQRLEMLANLEIVDAVVLFHDEAQLQNVIRHLQPDVMVKGEEYREKHVVGADLVANRGGEVVFLPRLKKFSSTAIAEAMSVGEET